MSSNRWVPSDPSNTTGLTFDFDMQEYRNTNGEVIPDVGDFPCPKCRAPSEMTSYDAYYEYYKCMNLNCTNEFRVN